jgi:hypothetical protein
MRFLKSNKINHELQKLLSDLISSDKSIKSEAISKLRKFEVANEEELNLIHEYIGRDYPDDNDLYFSTKYYLFSYLWKFPNDKNTELVRNVFDNLPDNPSIRFAALRLLTENVSEKGLRLFINILNTKRPDLGSNTYALFMPLQRNLESLKFIANDLVDLIISNYAKWSIYNLFCTYRENLNLNDDKKSILFNQIVKDINEVKDKDGEDSKNNLEILVDLISIFPLNNDIKKILEEQSGNVNLKIALFAVVSLIRLGIEPSNTILNKLAASYETRLDLFNYLKELNKEELFPKEYYKQELFAESDMVRWLCSPFEYGKAPGVIELITTKEITIDNKSKKIYLFKFKYPGENSWMVGLCGPYSIDTSDMKLGNLTFSKFTKLEEKSIEEHVKNLISI